MKCKRTTLNCEAIEASFLLQCFLYIVCPGHKNDYTGIYPFYALHTQPHFRICLFLNLVAFLFFIAFKIFLTAFKMLKNRIMKSGMLLNIKNS